MGHISPLGFLVAFALVLICVLVIRHLARGVVVAAVIVPFVYWLLDFGSTEIWVGTATAVVIVIRFYLEDWNREYRELWLDRE